MLDLWDAIFIGTYRPFDRDKDSGRYSTGSSSERTCTFPVRRLLCRLLFERRSRLVPGIPRSRNTPVGSALAFPDRVRKTRPFAAC